MNKILIVGGNGTVGSSLAKQLQSLGHPVLKATSRIPKNNDEVKLHLVTKEGMAHSFQDVDRVFLLSPPGYTNQDELLIPLITKAKENGIKKIVLMTAMGADANDEAPMRRAEKYLESSGLNYNIIRPNWFMQNFNSFWIQGILSDHKIYLPVGDAKGSFIDARDIAAVAARLLTSSQFDNKAFNLTGQESLNHFEVAGIMTEVLNKQITYQEISPESMREGLLKAGLGTDYTEFLLMILNFFKLGYSSTITDSVERITGQRPIRFSQYVSDYRASWIK